MSNHRNREYTLKYNSLVELKIEEGSLLRYIDGEGNKVVFVVDTGDGDQFGIEEYRSYPYKVIENINDRLKLEGLATVKIVNDEKSLAYHISHFTSRDYRFIKDVKWVNLDSDTETNYGKGYWLHDEEYNIIDSGLLLSDAVRAQHNHRGTSAISADIEYLNLPTEEKS